MMSRSGAFFSSSNGFVRAAAWLLAFTLLTIGWLLLLSQLPADRADTALLAAGFGTTGSSLTIALAPPILMLLLGAVLWQVSAPAPLPAAAPPAKPGGATGTVAAAAPPPPPAPPLRIGAWAALTPCGEASQTIAACLAQQIVYQPDRMLRGLDGHPLHAAQIAPLPLEAFAFPDDTRQRSHRLPAMLVNVLDALHGQQLELVESGDAPVAVYWLLPASMAADQHARACFDSAWVRSGWRALQYTLQMASALSVNTHGLIDVLQQQMPATSTPYVLLIGADSLIDPADLVPALAQGRVFGGNTPHGYIPAEAAAGLLLFNPSVASERQLFGLSTLYGTGNVARPTQRGPKAKVHAAPLSASLGHVLAASAVEAAQVGAVIGDADHTMPPTMELVQAMAATLPHLDPLAQRISPMAAAGCFGAASALVHLALAAELAADLVQPVAALAVSDPQRVSAALIVPAAV
jgi:hypothetical protein